MKDKAFVDSNIWLYIFGQDQQKKLKVARLLHENHIISTQVLSENMNVCIKKFKLSKAELENHLSGLITYCEVVLLTETTMKSALDIHHRLGYSFYDSQIIAAALEHNCTILYSEDLQHDHQIDGRLKILKPFIL